MRLRKAAVQTKSAPVQPDHPYVFLIVISLPPGVEAPRRPSVARVWGQPPKPGALLLAHGGCGSEDWGLYAGEQRQKEDDPFYFVQPQVEMVVAHVFRLPLEKHRVVVHQSSGCEGRPRGVVTRESSRTKPE